MFNAIKKFILKDIVLHVKDIRSLQLLRNVHSDYVPWTGASVHPTALLYLLNDITIHRRRHIVECGAGISTIYICSLLKSLQQETKFHSVDHDEKWLSLIRNYLEERNLLDYAELVHAPLTDHKECFNGKCTWYDTVELESKISGPPIDLLFIDGPPANDDNSEYARYPALPYFRPKLSDDFSVVLDDASRRGERLITRRWQEVCGVTFKQSILKGDISVASRGNKYNVL
jgi:predicted O-methyltransferase YrrM